MVVDRNSMATTVFPVGYEVTAAGCEVFANATRGTARTLMEVVIQNERRLTPFSKFSTRALFPT